MKKALICIGFLLPTLLLFGQKMQPTRQFLEQIAYWEILKVNAPTKIFEWEVYENSKENIYLKVETKTFLLFPVEKEIRKIKEMEEILKQKQKTETFLLGNSNLLDFLLENPHKIPSEWKEEKIFFRGTLFEDKEGYLIIRYLFFNKNKKEWGWDWSYYEEDDYLLGKILLIK